MSFRITESSIKVVVLFNGSLGTFLLRRRPDREPSYAIGHAQQQAACFSQMINQNFLARGNRPLLTSFLDSLESEGPKSSFEKSL